MLEANELLKITNRARQDNFEKLKSNLAKKADEAAAKGEYQCKHFEENLEKELVDKLVCRLKKLGYKAERKSMGSYGLEHGIELSWYESTVAKEIRKCTLVKALSDSKGFPEIIRSKCLGYEDESERTLEKCRTCEIYIGDE